MQRMVRVIQIGLMVCGFLFGASSSGVCAPSGDSTATASSCKSFVQGFYDWYSAQSRKISSGVSIEQAVLYKNGSFGAELTKLLLADFKAQSNVQGEIVGLDFDPFLSTNAEPARNYTAGSVTKRGDSFRVPVFATYQGKKQVKPIVVPEVTQQNGRLVFTNFHYMDSSPENENLIAILKGLAKARQTNK